MLSSLPFYYTTNKRKSPPFTGLFRQAEAHIDDMCAFFTEKIKLFHAL
jgi:hypothetical protein